MIKWLTFIVLLILVILSFVFFVNKGKDSNKKNTTSTSSGIVAMKITSSAFANEALIPAKYTCDGQDVNPPLTFSEIPKDAKSLALVVEDPDAPSGTWTHWIVWNINPETSKIEEGKLPEGAVEGTNDFQSVGYGGPCPPGAEHRYMFNLFALDSQLNLPTTTKREELLSEIAKHKLSETELIGVYKR